MGFDSRQYQFSDITLILGGKDIATIRGIKYNVKQEKEVLYAKGNVGQSIQAGNISVEGEVTLLQSDLHALIDSGGGTVLSLSLDANVSYGNALPIRTDRIETLQFTEEPREMKQGDKFMEVTLPFIALNVKNKV